MARGRSEMWRLAPPTELTSCQERCGHIFRSPTVCGFFRGQAICVSLRCIAMRQPPSLEVNGWWEKLPRADISKIPEFVNPFDPMLYVYPVELPRYIGGLFHWGAMPKAMSSYSSQQKSIIPYPIGSVNHVTFSIPPPWQMARYWITNVVTLMSPSHM
jgi:hypothetical protein